MLSILVTVKLGVKLLFTALPVTVETLTKARNRSRLWGNCDVTFSLFFPCSLVQDWLTASLSPSHTKIFFHQIIRTGSSGQRREVTSPQLLVSPLVSHIDVELYKYGFKNTFYFAKCIDMNVRMQYIFQFFSLFFLEQYCYCSLTQQD